MSARILIVEDDPVSRDLLLALLQCKGHEVDTATDGFNGLCLAQDHAYDLVFVDYHLPEMDGYAFARLMRSLAERHERSLTMIAITADRFGLAARRGVDAVFDRLLTKPIDPEALYDCVNTFVVSPSKVDTVLSEIDAFLGEPTDDDAQSASHVLWRVRGMSCLPNAAIFPTPTAAERQALSYCFALSGPETADCIVVVNEAGLDDVATLRRNGPRYLLPVFGVGAKTSAACDAIFDVGDAESWTRVARVIKNVQLRTVLLKTDIRNSDDAGFRLLAYLFVSERAILLRRDAFGRTRVSYTAGFAPDCVITTLKDLAAKGFVSSRLGDTAADGTKELSIVLSERGQARILDEHMSHDRSTAG